MKVLITGASGQLGQEILSCRTKDDGLKLIGVTRQEMDVTDRAQVMKVVASFEPDAIIHAAAYTAVDQAESERDFAYDVNALGAKHIAEAAESVGAGCCMISTDYVFNGNSDRPYKTTDLTDPINWYGYTKREGERFVQSISSRFFIVRTSWVYGPFGKNFFNTMLRFGKEKPLQVVDDQIGSPTYTADLAAFLLQLIQTEKYGVYHATNQGSCSWYEFAKAIFEEAGMKADLTPCTSDSYPTEAKRPAFSVMDHESILQSGFQDFRHWREGLQACLKRIKNSTA